jgi:hypothetical protein
MYRKCIKRITIFIGFLPFYLFGGYYTHGFSIALTPTVNNRSPPASRLQLHLTTQWSSNGRGVHQAFEMDTRTKIGIQAMKNGFGFGEMPRINRDRLGGYRNLCTFILGHSNIF